MPGAEGGEVVWFALLNFPSRNSSNKCTFHTKVSLLVLLNLDSPSVDCKLKSLCGPKAILTANAQQWRWPQIGFLSAVCVAAAHVPLPIVKLASIYFCLYDSWGLRFIRELARECELMTQWFYTYSLDREFARSCELWVVSALLVLLKAEFIPQLLDTRIWENLVLGRDWLFSWQTWSIKNKAVPYNLPSHRIPVAKTVYVPAAESRLLSACTAP